MATEDRVYPTLNAIRRALRRLGDEISRLSSSITGIAKKYVPYVGANKTVNLNNQSLVNINQLGVGIAVPAELIHAFSNSGAVVVLSESDGSNAIFLSDYTGTANVGGVAIRRSGATIWRLYATGAADNLEVRNQADAVFSRWLQTGVFRHGAIAAGNYFEIGADGSPNFNGTARIDWKKITADSITLSNGTSTDALADLQTAHDGSFYHINEVAGAPGIRLIVDFVSVTAFNWVEVIAIYDGSSSHAVGIQLYNWSTTAWDTFDALQTGQEDVTTADGYILCNHGFLLPADTNYIGTGGSAGQVRVRFNHTMNGNASHDMYIDVVALYQ